MLICCSPRHTNKTFVFVISGASAVADWTASVVFEKQLRSRELQRRTLALYRARGLICCCPNRRRADSLTLRLLAPKHGATTDHLARFGCGSRSYERSLTGPGRTEGADVHSSTAGDWSHGPELQPCTQIRRKTTKVDRGHLHMVSETKLLADGSLWDYMPLPVSPSICLPVDLHSLNERMTGPV